MTQEIMVLNPGKKGRRKKTMAKRRRTIKRAAPVARRTRRRARKNPTMSAAPRRRSIARRAVSRAGHTARGLLSSLQPLSTAKQALVGLAGALLCQFAAKKFGGDSPGGANDNWGKRNYLFGALGTVAGAALADMIKKGSGKNVLLGGLTLLAYKIFTNEIAPQNTFLQTNFGADENTDLLMGYGQDGYQIGDVYTDGIGDDYLLGAGGWQPMDESHRILTGTDEILMGETLTPPNHLGFGETLVAPGSLGYGADPYQTVYGGAN
jgi:hypothetical protein